MKKTAPSLLPQTEKYALQIKNAKSKEELVSAVKECGLDAHLQFIMEKEEKISLLYS